MKTELYRIPIRDLKSALDANMSACASHTNRVRALSELAKSRMLEPSAFEAVIGQHPDTLDRDLRIAEAEFQNAKQDYEDYCRASGVPAYQTYNED